MSVNNQLDDYLSAHVTHPNKLVPGNCYFLVHYYDRDLLVPDIGTLIFRESVIDEETGDRLWLFDDPTNDAKESGDELPCTLGMRGKELHQIQEIDGLIATLKALSDFHPIKQSAASRGSPGMSKSSLKELGTKIRTFLEDTEYCSLTITVLFTDDGLSLSRRKNGDFGIGFFPHPKEDPDEERRIVKFFESLGVQSHVDYLSDKGRTRILEYPIIGNVEKMVDIGSGILTEVHNIREDDRLEFTFLRHDDVA